MVAELLTEIFFKHEEKFLSLKQHDKVCWPGGYVNIYPPFERSLPLKIGFREPTLNYGRVH